MPRTLPPSAGTPTRTAASKRSRIDRLTADYRRDHRNPVNHFLHVGVGWPLCSLGVIAFPFRPLWGVGLFALGYAFMFTGHFIFERNIPTIFKHPTTPFVIAGKVISAILGGMAQLVLPRRQA